MMLPDKKDFQYTWRALVREPLFILAVVLPLAMGIGANTAIFSVADALLRQPLPFTDLNRLVLMTESSPLRPDASFGVTTANYLDWKAQSKSFESLAAFSPEESGLTGSGTPEAITAASVTNNFFSTLGIVPVQGRTFSGSEVTGEQENAVVLSYGFWERRFAANRDILGKELTIDSGKYTIIGILKKGSGFPVNADLWKPLVLGPREIADRNTHRLQVLGRLLPGTTLPRAQAEMKEIASRLGKAYPDTNQGWGARVYPLGDFISGGLTARYTLLMMGAVLFVLLIVCSNIANLQLVRGIVRKREWSLRYALGATRWHVIRILLIESTGLAFVSAGLAIWFANVSLRLIRVNMPGSIARFIPGFDQISLNPRAMVFTVGIAVFSGIASGLLPALYSSRTDINKELKEGGKGSTTDRSHQRLSTILLVSEVAITLMLLVGTGLMVRGSTTIRQTFADMRPEQVLTARFHLGPQYAQPSESLKFYQRLLEQLARIPGVSSSAVATNIPYGENARTAPVTVQGAPPTKAGERNSVMVQIVSADFFHTIGIPVESGRVFQVSDDENAAPVAIVSKQMARRYWPGQDPIGRQIQIGGITAPSAWLRVVGIAQDVRYNWLDADAGYVVYRPVPQVQQRSAFLLLRTQADPHGLVRVLRQSVATINQEQPLSDVQSWDEVISQSMIGLSYVRVMMLVLAVLAIVVASVGIYGLMSYTVATKREEIGIRMALGAQRRQIMNMIIGRGMLITNIGLAIGLLGSFVLTRILASLVFGISALDPLTFLGAAAIFVGVALMASYLPARQASKVDPLSVFKSQ
jgi:putative ABC transport system permease protein